LLSPNSVESIISINTQQFFLAIILILKKCIGKFKLNKEKINAKFLLITLLCNEKISGKAFKKFGILQFFLFSNRKMYKSGTYISVV